MIPGVRCLRDSSGDESRGDRVTYWETIADRLSNAGWSLGWVSAVDSQGEQSVARIVQR
jgi:hypothetical protein